MHLLAARPRLVIRPLAPGEPLDPSRLLPEPLAGLALELHERGWLDPSQIESARGSTPARLRASAYGRRLGVTQEGRVLSLRVALRSGPGVLVRRPRLLELFAGGAAWRRNHVSTRHGALWIAGTPNQGSVELRGVAERLARVLESFGLSSIRLGPRWLGVQRLAEPEPRYARWLFVHLVDAIYELAAICDSAPPLIAEPDSEAPPPPRGGLLRLRLEAQLRCPYCHAGMSPRRELTVRCASCGTLHHHACALELGRCTTLGCGESAFHLHRHV